MTVLVLGFGPFATVDDNPASALARALNGRKVGLAGCSVVGLEMPVSYVEAPALTREWIRRVGPIFTLGIGVAASRTEPMVERVGRNQGNPIAPDIRGLTRLDHGPGPAERRAASAERLAAALGFALSDDAGDYVCNAWLYDLLGTEPNAAFLHVPLPPLDPAAVAEGLGRFVDGRGADRSV